MKKSFNKFFKTKIFKILCKFLQASVVVKCELSDFAALPYNIHQYKTMEGWVRRQRLRSDNSAILPKNKRESKWIRSWMVKFFY